MKNGFIKLHRSMLDWGWYQDTKTLHVWLTILLNTNHDEGEWKGHKIKKGQWLTGRKKISAITGMSEQEVRTSLSKLKSTGEVTIKSTKKFSMITVVKWGTYQIKKETSTKTLTNESTNNQPTVNHKQECKEVITYLNNKTGKSFNAGAKGNIEFISGRLNEGYTVDDCKAVIDNQCAAWLGKIKMEEYVRPQTLFAPTKFDGYLNNKKASPAMKPFDPNKGY